MKKKTARMFPNILQHCCACKHFIGYFKIKEGIVHSINLKGKKVQFAINYILVYSNTETDNEKMAIVFHFKISSDLMRRYMYMKMDSHYAEIQTHSFFRFFVMWKMYNVI